MFLQKVLMCRDGSSVEQTDNLAWDGRSAQTG